MGIIALTVEMIGLLLRFKDCNYTKCHLLTTLQWWFVMDQRVFLLGKATGVIEFVYLICVSKVRILRCVYTYLCAYILSVS